MEKYDFLDKSFQITYTTLTIIKNENKRLSRNKKRRIEQKMATDDKMQFSFNKNKAEKKKIDRFKQLENKLVKIKYVSNPNLLESKLKELNKNQGIDEKLYEI